MFSDDKYINLTIFAFLLYCFVLILEVASVVCLHMIFVMLLQKQTKKEQTTNPALLFVTPLAVTLLQLQWTLTSTNTQYVENNYRATGIITAMVKTITEMSRVL